MNNREKYDAAFIEVFEIEESQLNSSLEYQSITPLGFGRTHGPRRRARGGIRHYA